MAAVELDRQSIEKRDFPISRRGYDPATVDAHLRALAVEIEGLLLTLDNRAGESLGSTAGNQVQGILEAAEATATDIEQKASDDARATRAEANGDAERTRADAVKQARAHVAAVAQAAAVLIERVESMDGEVSTLVESLRAGATRLAGDLAAVETNMGELYDAASGQTVTRAVSAEPPASIEPALPIPAPATPQAPSSPPLSAPEGTQSQTHIDPKASTASQVGTASSVVASPSPAATNGDLDGARLIALNMALNGDPRATTDRYLAEHYELADRQKLLDEVYAAIEG
jgi:hypothetical protein